MAFDYARWIFVKCCRTVGVCTSRVGGNGNVSIIGSVASSDFRTLLLNLARMINYRLVVFVRAMGEVHADKIETGSSELVDGIDRVRLGADSADDGGPTVILDRLELFKD